MGWKGTNFTDLTLIKSIAEIDCQNFEFYNHVLTEGSFIGMGVVKLSWSSHKCGLQIFVG